MMSDSPEFTGRHALVTVYHRTGDGGKRVRFVTLRLDFAPRFFEPLSVDLKSETLPTPI
jgi:hypothetical protein